jgi:hypothetical protein
LHLTPRKEIRKVLRILVRGPNVCIVHAACHRQRLGMTRYKSLIKNEIYRSANFGSTAERPLRAKKTGSLSTIWQPEESAEVVETANRR